MSVVLIHPFNVSTNQEKEFLRAWKKVDLYMQSQQGFIKTSLHKGLTNNNLKAFSFVNIAIWTSPASFAKAVNNETFRILAADVLTFSCGPGLYEIIEGIDL